MCICPRGERYDVMKCGVCEVSWEAMWLVREHLPKEMTFDQRSEEW